MPVLDIHDNKAIDVVSCRVETCEEQSVKTYDAKQSAEALQRLVLVRLLP